MLTDPDPLQITEVDPPALADAKYQLMVDQEKLSRRKGLIEKTETALENTTTPVNKMIVSADLAKQTAVMMHLTLVVEQHKAEINQIREDLGLESEARP